MYLDPASPRTHLHLAEALSGTGKARAALPHVERALRLAAGSPHEGRAHLAKARVLAALGREGEARVAAKRAVELDDELQQAAKPLLSR